MDNTSKRVVFAESGKDFVDFLFGLLELPLGTLIRLLAEEGMGASWTFGKVYESVKNLEADYLQTEQTKQVLLCPSKPSSNTKSNTHLMQQLGYAKPESSVYSSGYGSRSDDYKKNNVDGYVKGMATYMISDDLTVKPVSPISSISLINSLAVKDIGSLEEKNVKIDMKKALELVKTSFESNTVLTDVFIGKIKRR